jgi:hypothetical protein
MAVLTSRGRKRMKASQFALPGKRYPIHDIRHGRNALARVAQHGSARERAIVRRRVYNRFPSLRK